MAFVILNRLILRGEGGDPRAQRRRYGDTEIAPPGRFSDWPGSRTWALDLCETEVGGFRSLEDCKLMARAGIFTDKVQLKADSPPMQAYVARPQANGPHSGLMVFQEAFGVNAHIRDVAERFATQGYVAIAPELFHRTAPAGFEAAYGDFASVRPHLEAISPEAAETDIRATYQWLESNPQVKRDEISCVGFCMGGRVSFIADSVVPLHAAISFYGGGIAQDSVDRAKMLHAPILLIWGGLDQHIPLEIRRSVVDAVAAQHKPYVNAEFSRADHGFFCDHRASYEPQSARQAWALTLEFLRS
jgi:carboxymethylenebutenolidase